jgi:hypothetical protein
MFVARKGRVGMLAAGSIVISALGVAGAFADGTPSLDSTVVRDGAGWYTQAYENTDTGDYTTPDQSDVTGPQRAPFGPGSHKMTIGQFSVQTELYRTDDFDGVNLGDLTRLEYSTFARSTNGGALRQPTYLRLNVDDDNNGTRDHSLFFYPANNQAQQDVANGVWQNWDVYNGEVNIDGDSGSGDTTLADYAAENPDATLINNAPEGDTNPTHDGGSLSLLSGAANTMTNGEYFVDRVIVGVDDADTLYDFGPSAEDNGGTTDLTVDPGHSQGWQHQAYDETNYLNSNQQFVTGPGAPPAGDGSLQMTLNTADNDERVELFRTEQYDGSLVRDLRTITYSTYTQADAGNTTLQQPVYMRLSVDTDGDGATNDSLFFYPANNGTPAENTWQDWNPGTGLWNNGGDTGAGEFTLEQYAVAHPDAVIVKNEDSSTPSQVDGGVSFIAGGGGAGQMNGEYFLDAIDISKVDAATGSVDSGKFFDLEPTPAPPGPVAIEATLTGTDNGADADKLKVNAPDEAAGATVTLYRVLDGEREIVATKTLNDHGNRKFTVADTNGNHYTKYFAKVSATDATQGARTNSLRVR